MYVDLLQCRFLCRSKSLGNANRESNSIDVGFLMEMADVGLVGELHSMYGHLKRLAPKSRSWSCRDNIQIRLGDTTVPIRSGPSLTGQVAIRDGILKR